MALHEETFDLFEIGLVSEAMDIVTEELNRLPSSFRMWNVSCGANVFAIQGERSRSHEKML